MASLLSSFTESVRANVDRINLIASEWVPKNFSHPKDHNIPWSFKDHEYGIEILDQGDDVPSVDMEKCAQVGATTLEIIATLTFLAQHDYLKAAYVLPTAKFATEFSALRLNEAILGSDTISSMVGESDNTSMKKVGTCFLVMRGTTGEKQAISVDLDLLVVDELNFCNQKVLSTFSSRLQHSLLKLRRSFSTPTLPGFGISQRIKESSAAERGVKCVHCSKWVFLDFFTDVVIPGFDKPMRDYRKGDHTLDGVRNAYLKCPNCHKPLTTENLNDPKKRQWVHKFPDRLERGYSVSPWDVPVYNPIPELLLDIKNYTYQDWVNFRIGKSFESSENSFVIDTVEMNSVVQSASIDSLRSGASGIRHVFIGADLGKTNHVMIGVSSEYGLDVVCCCRVTNQDLLNLYGEANFGKWLYDLFISTWGIKIVVDHAPSWEPALYLHSKLPEGKSFGAYYVNQAKGSLDIYSFNPKKGVVNIHRTKHFDDAASAVNNSIVKFPKHKEEMEVVKDHLKVMKKVKGIDNSGNVFEYWDSTSEEDHYAHALGYLWAAFSSVERRENRSALVLPPGFRGVRTK